MKQQIKYQPCFSMLQVSLEPNETLIVEAGSMAAHSSDIAMEVKLNASKKTGCFGKLLAIFIAYIRFLIGKESFFVNHFSSKKGGEVWVSPTLNGNIHHLRMQGQRMLFGQGSYLASTGDVELHPRWGGLRAIFAKEGGFFLEAKGSGDLWFNSYGAIQEIQCDGSYIVDNGHIVGFDADLQMKIRTAGGGVKGFLASGEGLVCEFSGQGRIWLQTRSKDSLVDWVNSILPIF